MKWAVIYERGEDGSWGAHTPDLPVAVVGDSREDAERLVRESVAFHLEGLREDGLGLPEPRAEAGAVEVAA